MANADQILAGSTTANNVTLRNADDGTLRVLKDTTEIASFGAAAVKLGTDAIQVDSSGNVGIGVTPSAWYVGKAFEVGFAGNAIWGATANNVHFLAGALYGPGNGYTYKVSGEAVSSYRQASGAHEWRVAPSGTAGNAITWTTAMTLDANARMYIPMSYTDTTSNASNCYIGSDGHINRSTSALKYKRDIRDLESIDINLFRPVRYKSKSEADGDKDFFGIIADEVDAAGITELVSYGANGEVEGFQYERLTVVLLKKLQELSTELTQVKAELAAMKAGA